MSWREQRFRLKWCEDRPYTESIGYLERLVTGHRAPRWGRDGRWIRGGLVEGAQKGTPLLKSHPGENSGVANGADSGVVPTARRRGRVLIVDDEQAVGRTIQRLLGD